jgi:hypothetical protein
MAVDFWIMSLRLSLCKVDADAQVRQPAARAKMISLRIIRKLSYKQLRRQLRSLKTIEICKPFQAPVYIFDTLPAVN